MANCSREGRTECENGLCGGCMSHNWNSEMNDSPLCESEPREIDFFKEVLPIYVTPSPSIAPTTDIYFHPIFINATITIPFEPNYQLTPE